MTEEIVWIFVYDSEFCCQIILFVSQEQKTIVCLFVQNSNHIFFLIISDQAEEFDREWGQKTREHRHSPSSLEYQRRRERSDRRREHLAIDGGKRKDKHTYRERD